MSGTDELLKIGTFAKLAGTNLRTLRYYEELDLVRPALRSAGGFRYYRPADLHRVRMIRDLQELGLPLERIAALLATRDSGSDRRAWLERVDQALRIQEALIDERVEALHRQRVKVAAARAKLAECSPCQHCPSAANNFCEPCQNTGQRLPDFLAALF